MERNLKLELVVGVFLILGILGFVALAIQVSGLNPATYTERHYYLYARFNNIAGLTNRAKVTMAGVNVGTVDRITLDKTNEQALVRLRIKATIDFLTTDTSATILTSGLLGERYIELTSGADETILQDGDFLEFTQSALVLENLIGRFLFERGQE